MPMDRKLEISFKLVYRIIITKDFLQLALFKTIDLLLFDKVMFKMDLATLSVNNFEAMCREMETSSRRTVIHCKTKEDRPLPLCKMEILL